MNPEMWLSRETARGKQGGEWCEWGALGDPVHHRGTLSLACGDEVVVMRHVANLGLCDRLDDGECWGGYGVFFG